MDEAQIQELLSPQPLAWDAPPLPAGIRHHILRQKLRRMVELEISLWRADGGMPAERDARKHQAILAEISQTPLGQLYILRWRKANAERRASRLASALSFTVTQKIGANLIASSKDPAQNRSLAEAHAEEYSAEEAALCQMLKLTNTQIASIADAIGDLVPRCGRIALQAQTSHLRRSSQTDRRPDVFVSYSRADRDRAFEIARTLEASQLEVWIDDRIGAGQDFERQIDLALKTTACVLVCLSESAVESPWVKIETANGLARDSVVTCLVRQFAPPAPFDKLHYEDLVAGTLDETNNAWNKTMMRIRDLIATPWSASQSPASAAALQELLGADFLQELGAMAKRRR